MQRMDYGTDMINTITFQSRKHPKATMILDMDGINKKAEYWIKLEKPLRAAWIAYHFPTLPKVITRIEI